MIGALFYRKVPISEIKSMKWLEMNYFYKWHKAIEKEYKKAADAVQEGS